MNENQQLPLETQKIEYYQDEIELIDILKVIWKWKYFILLGTAVCGFVAVLITFNLPKIYRIDMTLQPGIVNIDQRGNKVYIDSAENIKTIIQTNVLQNESVKYLQKDDRKNTLTLSKFKVSVPRKSEIINISYETSNVEFGINVMKAIYQTLCEQYDESVKYYQDNYDKEIQNAKAEFNILEAESLFYEQSIKGTQKRIKELEALIDDINKKNSILIRQRNEIIQKKETGEKNLSLVLYNNTIQQNLSTSNQYRNDIKEYLYKLDGMELKNIERRYQKQKLSKNIEILEYKMDSVQNIKMLQSPTATTRPIKPKTKLNVIFALLAGLFIMVFLSFFIEYLRKHKKVKDYNPSSME